MRVLVERGRVVCDQIRQRKYYDIKKVFLSIFFFFSDIVKKNSFSRSFKTRVEFSKLTCVYTARSGLIS